jgi:hypothetical protein
MTKPLELVWVQPGEAQPNPRNWRRHPEEQLAALDELIFGEQDGVGWAGVALINNRQVEDGWAEDDAVATYVDGHARELLAQEHGREVPALVGRWTPTQEAMILATLDPTAELVEADKSALWRLLERSRTGSEAVMNVLAKAAEEAGLYKEWMQGTDSPTLSANAAELAGEFGDPFEDDDLVDHGGGLGNFTSLARVTWPGWRLLMTEPEEQGLVERIEAFARETGMTNYFVSRVLLDGRTEPVSIHGGAVATEEEEE